MPNLAPNPCPPWTLQAWPPLLWQVRKPVPLQLQHLGTQISHLGDTSLPSHGQTMWACQGDQGEVGLAWDWVQIARGVVALADPMAIVTNLRLIGEAGEALSNLEAARHINEIVHALPWQHEVTRTLDQHRLLQ